MAWGYASRESTTRGGARRECPASCPPSLPRPGSLADELYPLTPIDRTTFASPFGPLAFVGWERDRPGLARWRMRCLRRHDRERTLVAR